MICPACGVSNPEEATLCLQCKSLLAAIDTPCLVGLAGAFFNQCFVISEAGLQVGRTPAPNQLTISAPEISRLHARIVLEAGGVVKLTDSSVNGTFVNGQRITEAVLQIGDRVRFGPHAEHTFGFYAAKAEPEPMAAALGAAAGIEHNFPVERTFVSPTPATRPSATVMMTAEQEEGAPRCRLQLIIDQYSARDIPIEGQRLELGRGQGRGKVSIEHASVSSQHAELVVLAGKTVLRDLGSTNGTFVNGEKTSEKVLQEGDLIQLGSCDSHLFLYRESIRRAIVLRDIELNAPVVSIGRDPGNSIHLNHPTVSARHAEVHKHNGTFELIDLSSTNGTFVNGQRITRKVLQPHDRISLGAVQFLFDGIQMEQQSDGSRVRLTARDLRVDVKDLKTGAPLRLLDDVSLVVEPREFVGFLGPSGAGKSTLMDVLNGSRMAQHGKVQLNSADLYAELDSLRALFGYLPQEDILHRQLTVRECLYYAARLRLPDDFGEKDTRNRVQEVIQMLDLAERADISISQLSGGQRKRVSLGIELLSKPALLFVDEPTAGQDPRTEMKMMQLFREIASRGSTVIINTHLLGSFSLLDKVAVLVRGKLAYYGGSQEMLPYFNARRPHEIYDRLQEQKPEQWAAQYRQSDQFRECIGDALAGDSSTASHPTPTETRKPRPRSRWRQFLTLVSRQIAIKTKEKSMLAYMVLPPVVIAALLAAMKRAVNEPKVLFAAIVVALWMGCSSSVREIVDEAPIYKRERQRDLSLISYLGSKLVYVAGAAALQAAVFIGLLAAFQVLENHLLEVAFLTWIMTIQGGLIGLLISSVFSTAEKALYAFPLTMIPQLLLAGLLIPVVTLKPFIPVLLPNNRLEIQQLPAVLAPAGMGPVLRYGLSPLVVSRWGLEAISDLYIHDNKEYSFPILNYVSITLHPNDASQMRAQLEKIQVGGSAAAAEWNETPNAFLGYLGILAGFAVVLIGATALALKGKESRAG
jgi:ABC-type multidrug transport system ATPase subunit/pSer/pThr/pTyr-binding forkhead associated (FHA) protein